MRLDIAKTRTLKQQVHLAQNSEVVVNDTDRDHDQGYRQELPKLNAIFRKNRA